MSVPESVTAFFSFFVIVSASSKRKIAPLAFSSDFDIFFVGSCNDSDICADGRNKRFGNDECFAEIAVKSFGEIAGKFEMLFLVLPDRNEIGLIQKNVRSHQNRICKKPDSGAFGVAFCLCL